MTTEYEPKPIVTSDITLSDELRELQEKLAASTHDNWAIGRFQEGWTWGKTRDDKAKTHPMLVPYEDLPESEKEYDRTTAMETLKAIVALGFTIEKSK